MRLSIAALGLITAVALAAFFAGFVTAHWAVRSAQAVPPTCGGTQPACNTHTSEPKRYYAAQHSNLANPLGAKSNGLRGYLSVEDVTISDRTCDVPYDSDPNCDFMNNGLAVVGQGGSLAQIGFVEGALEAPVYNFNSATPKLYTETSTVCLGVKFFVRSTPSPNPRYNEFLGVEWDGASGSCTPVGGGPPAPVHSFWFKRGGSFAPFDVAFMSYKDVFFYAQTEHFDNEYMEPNGTQCFGGAGCTAPTYGYDLWLWNKYSGYHELWSTSRPTTIVENQNGNSAYFHTPVESWWSFKTTGTWQ